MVDRDISWVAWLHCIGIVHGKSNGVITTMYPIDNKEHIGFKDNKMFINYAHIVITSSSPPQNRRLGHVSTIDIIGKIHQVNLNHFGIKLLHCNVHHDPLIHPPSSHRILVLKNLSTINIRAFNTSNTTTEHVFYD